MHRHGSQASTHQAEIQCPNIDGLGPTSLRRRGSSRYDMRNQVNARACLMHILALPRSGKQRNSGTLVALLTAREGLGRWVHSETPGLRLSFKYSERAELFVSQEGADPRQQGLGVSHVAQEQEANRPDIGRVTVVDGVLDLLGVQLQGEQAVQQAEGSGRAPGVAAHPRLHVLHALIDFVYDLFPS